jgi:hypothetical protein
LRNNPCRDLLSHALDVVEGLLDTWTAMAALPTLATALLAAHESLKSAGVNERRLISLLRQLGSTGHLEAQAATHLEQDFQELVLVSSLFISLSLSSIGRLVWY